MTDRGFFVGYLNPPRALAQFNLTCGIGLFALFVVLAFALGRGGDAAADGATFASEEVSLQGWVELKPYPVLHAASGHTVMLVGEGKRGASAAVATYQGKGVKVSGLLLKRGELDTLLLDKVEPSTAPFTPAPAQPLGRWRVTGEICDGKCASGSMHPGSGLAHKACANLCVAGGLPPVLAMAAPLEGAHFLLLADVDGGPVPAAAYDLTAVPVELEGMLERRGDLLVLRAEWRIARVM